MRLAFAVAAFLEPEILIIDEVLAVGDAEFQKKCMGKMEDVSKNGRTILFVSHNLSALQSLCKSSMILSHGISSELMPSHLAVNKYLNTQEKSAISTDADLKKKAKIVEAVIRNSKHEVVQRINTYEDFYFEIHLEKFFLR